MKKLLETCLVAFAMFGWWGFIYPELCFTEETCQKIAEDGEVASLEQYEELYRALLINGLLSTTQMESVQIEWKSQLITWIQDQLIQK